MGRKSSVANHEMRGEIENALLANQSLAYVASRFGIHPSSLARYKKKVLGEIIKAASADDVQARAKILRATLEDLRVQMRYLGHKAEQTKDLKMAHKSLDSQARLLEIELKIYQDTEVRQRLESNEQATREILQKLKELKD